MKIEDIRRIESALNVKLPSDFVEFMISERNYDAIDEVSVFDDANTIIEATIAYRQGKCSQQWPMQLVYIGDESDACPYALDCISAELKRLDHGSIEIKPLETFSSFQEFLTNRYNDYKKYLESENAPPLTGFAKLRSDLVFNLRCYGPVMVALLIFFVVLPTIAYSIRELYRWITG